ncbi:MAG TPA: cupredoxin domain-containing protein [Bryobacteraceae bacterium]|nr:cupredoxin domain-containing protein [Bryobacteraceae bacterium]
MRMLLPALVLAAILAPQEGPRKPDRTVRITAERFSFTPSRIKLKQGTEVEFIITSEDTDHGFRIPAAGIDAAIPPAGRGELRVRFVAEKKGRYVFECSRPCGAGHNLMRGEIVVE